jgi:hypothetical protein
MVIYVLSACAISGWKQVLLDDNIAVPNESDNLNTVTDADRILFRKTNSAAYALLTVVVKVVTDFQAIGNGCTDGLPSGSARQAQQNLIRI